MQPTQKIKAKGEYAYSIKFSQAERERYDKIAEKHGFSTLSKLIRRALAVVETNPILLSEFPDIEQTPFEQAYKLIEQLQSQFQAQEKERESHEYWKSSVDDKLDWLLKKLATTKQDKQAVKRLQNSTGAMEVIFDE